MHRRTFLSLLATLPFCGGLARYHRPRAARELVPGDGAAGLIPMDEREAFREWLATTGGIARFIHIGELRDNSAPINVDIHRMRIEYDDYLAART